MSTIITGVKRFLHRMDTYPATVPQFNLHGKTAVRTGLGGLVSILAIYSTFIFAVHKLQSMLIRKNPLITTNKQENAVEASEVLETASDDFMMAFALRSFNENRSLSDPYYVKWVARLWTVVD